MSAEETMIQSLKDSGYEEITERSEMDEDNLGTKEFFVWQNGHQRILCLGPGQSGDTGAKIKLYFVDGVLMGHAALYEEPEEDE